MAELMNARTLEKMRASCQMAAECLVMVGERIGKTDEINTWVHEFTLARNAAPAPLGYGGGNGRQPFPKSVCTSVNEVICHGIPGPRVLKDGDIVNVDVTTLYPAKGGFHGDTSVTFYIGEPSEEAKLVVETARRCLELGIAEVKHGARLGDIGAAIQEYAESRGCSVVEDYVGHGVGRVFHTDPQVPHYGTRGKGKRVRAGMVFTIEPMINLGKKHTELDETDDWTVYTVDRSLSAQFEHTIVVTRDGCEVLTARPAIVKGSEDKEWSDLGPLSCPAGFAEG